MRVSIIVAMSINRVIGHENKVPWRLPADLKRFKQLTMGHHLVMGRKTFESIGRALPGRTTVLVTTQLDYTPPPGVLVAHSLDQALRMAAGDDEVFIAGGAQIYSLALKRADRLYVTLVGATFEGDTSFPDYDHSHWQLASKEDRELDPDNPYPYSFIVYDRKGKK